LSLSKASSGVTLVVGPPDASAGIEVIANPATAPEAAIERKSRLEDNRASQISHITLAPL
jgi:hypothetical protein